MAEIPKEVKISLFDSKKYFPSKTPLRFTDVALYSTTPVDQSEFTASLLLLYYDHETLKKKTLTDASACIGGNTWAFANITKAVNANELSKLHFDILKYNMKELNINNVEFYNEDYNKLVDLTNKPLKQDIIFLDPPWGGLDYREGVILKYGSVLVEDLICSKLVYQAELIICKLPNNTTTECLKKLKNSNFPYYEEIDIMTADAPIYKIVILSHFPRKLEIAKKAFERERYRGIKYQVM